MIARVDGEWIELDELSYEVGYTRGQMAERPKGRWIDLDDKEEIYASMWECSNCGALEISNEPPNYCYNCGARME